MLYCLRVFNIIPSNECIASGEKRSGLSANEPKLGANEAHRVANEHVVG